MKTASWNVAECLRMSAKRFPANMALKSKHRSLTYRELDRRTNKVANTLISLGLRKGDKCSVMLYNSIESIEIFLGLAKAGVVGVPVSFRFSRREVEYVVTHSDSKVIIFGEGFLDIVGPLAKVEIKKENILVVGQNRGGFESYEDHLTFASSDDPLVEVDEDDIWYIGYTSGTTAFPKGVETRHRAMLENATQWLVDYGRYDEDDRFLLIMPLFHANAIMCSLLMVIVGGFVYVHHSGGFNAEEILQIIVKEKITITSVVPTMLSMILNLPSEVKEKYETKSINSILVASSPLWTNIKEGTLNFFSSADLYEAYGSTEHQIVTVLKPKYQWEKIRSIGKPIIYKDVKLLDEEGNEVPVGQPGELYVRGWGIPLKEYYKNPEATAKAFDGEWSTVEDIAIMDEDGFYYLVDRKMDMIISGGENISPSEIENQIVEHPAVREVAIIGQPDEKWGDAVTAVIVLIEGMTVTEEEIKEFCRNKLARFKVPKFVDFVDELPKNATGKILRKKVREPYWKKMEGKI